MMYMRYDTLCDLTQIITAVLTKYIIYIIKYIKIIQVHVYVSDMKASHFLIKNQSFPSIPPKTKYIKIGVVYVTD